MHVYVIGVVVQSLSSVQLCQPMDCSPPGFSVHWIFQARILEWVAIFFFKGSFQPRDGTRVSYIASRRFSVRVIREVLPRGWSGNSCHQSLAAACSKSRFLDDPIPTESISRRGPRNLNFEPIPAVILMHLEIWDQLWQRLNIEGSRCRIIKVQHPHVLLGLHKKRKNAKNSNSVVVTDKLWMWCH